MSSGNPFRASLALHPAAAAAAAAVAAASSPEATVPRASFVAAETDHRPDGAAADVPVRTKKHVRIESTAISIPPQPQPQPDLSSPDDSSQTSFAPQSQHAASNYMSSAAGYSNSSPGAYSREPGRSSSYDMAGADGMASSSTASGTSFPALSPSAVPANPFAKTLASMEPQRAGGEDRAAAEGAAAVATGNSRASLDVESFKNMLLTGRPYPRHTTQPPQPPQPPGAPAAAAVMESGSSSTDTSSLSRQSLLEPAHEAPGESPRTSYELEMARSDEDDLAPQPTRTRSKRKPPPAPAHRHGKLVSPRQPQTVPFDSFTTTEALASPVTRPRNVSDTSTNKPLPPTPPILSPPPSADTLEKALPSPLSSPLSRSSSTQKKKAPPPVPLARRQSQLRHSSAGADNRSSRSSSLTLSSQQSLDVPTSNPLSPSAENAREVLERGMKSPPPPPPSRHGARLSDIGSSSPSAASPPPPPQRNSSVRTAASSSSRRSTLEGSSDAAPAPGSASASKRSSRVLSSSGDMAGSAMPPPPPPPRGARRAGSGSARSSLDTQRPALHSLASSTSAASNVEHGGRWSADATRRSSNGARRTSTDSRRTSTDLRRASGASGIETGTGLYEHGPAEEWALVSPREEAEDQFASANPRLGLGDGGEPSSEPPRKDSSSILDDMERFQREIDELRERYKGAG
ncbi:hypothetical protein G6514_001919 [Epicoccum nigrum]|nr:hypothetical protein G6514_001919 [Epicoccum nigrum]